MVEGIAAQPEWVLLNAIHSYRATQRERTALSTLDLVHLAADSTESTYRLHPSRHRMFQPESSPIIQYGIDEADRIIFVNDEWLAFARANQGSALLPPSLFQQSLWSHITEATTRQLYHDILLKVRSEAVPIHVPLRCDSPNCRRLLRLDITPLPDNQVLFTSRLIRSETRPRVALLEPTFPRTPELLTMCSWCKKVVTDDEQWLEVEQAVAYLELFQRDLLPELTHGICPLCLDQMTALLA